MPFANQPLRSAHRLALLTASLCLALLSSPALASPDQAISPDVYVQSTDLQVQTDQALSRNRPQVPILLAKDKSDQLDIGDERPVGEQGIMRGKKDLFGKRRVESPPDNSMLDLGIMLCGGALVVLVIFAFAYRPAPKAPQQDY